MPTLIDALRDATRDLAAAGLSEAGADARILLCAAADIARVDLVRDPDRPMPSGASARLAAWVARRRAREPVSRILGRRGFWGLTLRVTPDVLDPRPETETLIQAVLDGLEARRGDPLTVLDLGTGSGAILCALLAELPAAAGWAVDASPSACAVARDNLAACGLASRSLVLQGDWGQALSGDAFDVVVSNPPYVETGAIAGLDRDVRDYDPRPALDGGIDGLAAYRAIAADLPRLMAPGAIVALEVGRGQDRAVAALLTSAGLSDIATRRDLAGIDRVVTGRRERSVVEVGISTSPARTGT